MILKEKMNHSDEAEWNWIKPHVLRDAVIIVDPSLNLSEVQHEIGNNNSIQIQEWIQKGFLAKPSAEQIKFWDQYPFKKFMTVIVQPFVLIQEFLV